MNPLSEELVSLFGRGVDAPLEDGAFNDLALRAFAHQFAHNRLYGAYCRARGRTPWTVASWSEIPALPTAAFKEADLTTAPEEVRVVYLTSGTSRAGEKRGRHLLPDTRLYDASLLPNFKAHLLPDRDAMPVLVCGPSARFFPNSSLGHMNSRVMEEFGAPGSGIFWDDDGPRFASLAAALARAERKGTAICLLGTAFGFVHFLDWLEREGRAFRLPPGSRIMDTGGYKGRSREVPKEQLYALYGSRLGVPRTHVVNEYGMTEMGSQFYDRVLKDWLESSEADLKSGAHTSIHQHPHPQRRKVPPPWVRVRVLDPETLEPVPDGETGLLCHFDLANLHSVMAILTDDLGVRQGDGFEILGRAARAEPRGCSLAVEELPFVQAAR